MKRAMKNCLPILNEILKHGVMSPMLKEAIKETIALCQLVECLAELNVFAGIKINISPASNCTECMAQYESQFPTP